MPISLKLQCSFPLPQPTQRCIRQPLLLLVDCDGLEVFRLVSSTEVDVSVVRCRLAAAAPLPSISVKKKPKPNSTMSFPSSDSFLDTRALAVEMKLPDESGVVTPLMQTLAALKDRASTVEETVSIKDYTKWSHAMVEVEALIREEKPLFVELRNAKKRWDDKVEFQKDELATIQLNINAAQQDLDGKRLEANKIDNQINSKRSEFDKVTHDLAAANQQVSDAERDVETKKREVETLDDQMKADKEKAAQDIEAHSERANTLAAKETRLANFEQELTKRSTAMTSQESASDGRTEELDQRQRALDNRQKDYEAARRTLWTLAKRHGHPDGTPMQDPLTEFTTLVADIQRVQGNLFKAHSDLMAIVTEQESVIEAKEEESLGILALLNEAQTKIMDDIKANAHLTGENKALNMQVRRLEEESKQRQHDLEQKQFKLSALQRQHESDEQSIKLGKESYDKDLAQLVELQGYRDDHKDLSSRYEKLEKNYLEVQRGKTALESRLLSVRRENDKADDHVKTIRTRDVQLAEIKQRKEELDKSVRYWQSAYDKKCADHDKLQGLSKQAAEAHEQAVEAHERYINALETSHDSQLKSATSSYNTVDAQLDTERDRNSVLTGLVSQLRGDICYHQGRTSILEEQIKTLKSASATHRAEKQLFQARSSRIEELERQHEQVVEERILNQGTKRSSAEDLQAQIDSIKAQLVTASRGSPGRSSQGERRDVNHPDGHEGVQVFLTPAGPKTPNPVADFSGSQDKTLLDNPSTQDRPISGQKPLGQTSKSKASTTKRATQATSSAALQPTVDTAALESGRSGSFEHFARRPGRSEFSLVSSISEDDDDDRHGDMATPNPRKRLRRDSEGASDHHDAAEENSVTGDTPSNDVNCVFTLDQLRDASFHRPPIPDAVFQDIRKKMPRWEKNKFFTRSLPRGNTSLCAAQHSARRSAVWPDGREGYACSTCEEKNRICLIRDDDNVRLLPKFQSNVGPDNVKHWR